MHTRKLYRHKTHTQQINHKFSPLLYIQAVSAHNIFPEQIEIWRVRKVSTPPNNIIKQNLFKDTVPTTQWTRCVWVLKTIQ